MKRLLAFLLALTLLTGCAVTAPPSETVETTTEPTQTEYLGSGIYDPDSVVEQQTAGAVRAYPLQGTCDGVLLMGDMLLLYFPGDHTQLNAYTGDDLYLTTTVSRYPQIPADGVGIQVLENGLSYYSKGSKTLVILDEGLQEKHKVSLPDELQGIPVVSQDMTTVCYYTPEGIRALNLETGIAHMLRQQENRGSALTQSIFDGEMLVCVTTDEDGNTQTEIIQTSNGLKVAEDSAVQTIDTYGQAYFVLRNSDDTTVYQFGTGGDALQRFTPATADAEVISALELGGVLTVSVAETGSALDFYDLGSGLRTASVTLEAVTGIRDVAVDAKGYIWFLDDENILYRWEVSKSAVVDETVYTTPWYTSTTPDTDGLAECQKEADRIGQQYAVEIRIWKDAVLEPWDDMTQEFRVEVFENALPVLEQTLSIFPEGFLEQLGTICDSGKVTISLVADVGYNGSQIEWANGNAYIAVGLGDDLQTETLRMLYRVMDTYVLGKNSILDDWNADKPAEDRAQWFVEAMTAENEDYFASTSAQRKLRTLCRAIRYAFDLRKYGSMLPWEQYLNEPLY